MLVVGAYFLGTFPSAILVGRRRGVDPTTAGSGNPGASNVYRTAGKRAGVVVALADLAKGAIPAMRRVGGGSIVNVASVRSIVAGGNNLQYDTAKHAVAGLTRALAMDHGAEGIRVNAVRPGFTYTEIHARGGEPGRVDRLSGTVPLQRGAQPIEIARAILWLLSSEASYATGAILDIGGGK